MLLFSRISQCSFKKWKSSLNRRDMDNHTRALFEHPGSKPRSNLTAANRFMFSSFCHSSSLKAAKPPLGADEAPTTLTRISMPPKREVTSLTTFVHPADLTEVRLNKYKLTLLILIARSHSIACGCYDFGSSVKKSTYYGFANSSSSSRDKNAFATKLICDKRKFGCYNDSLLTYVLNFAFLLTLLSIFD